MGLRTKGLFTRAALNPSPDCSGDMQVDKRVEEEATRVVPPHPLLPFAWCRYAPDNCSGFLGGTNVLPVGPFLKEDSF